MEQDRGEELQDLIQSAEAIWRAVRGGETSALSAQLHPQFRADGFPTDPEPGSEPAPESGASAEPGAPEARRGESVRGLCERFREGAGLTNLHHVLEGAQRIDPLGIVQLSWMAEQGLGTAGSPRFVSGRVTLTFRREGERWMLAGWLEVAGPHGARDAQQRAADVEAIREQILRVFEAYRQRDQAMLRRTHTADWRGFALSSAAVGKGIDAYMRAAQRAMVSMQFEEYQIVELDAIFYGDVAIVPYVALVAGRTAQGRREQSRLRVMDVYLREPSGWNQVASNVCLHPEEIRGV